MYNNTGKPYPRMTGREIAEAKKALAQRNELTRANGFEANECDPIIKNYYHPASDTGQQIYMSYTGDELLDILITYMQDHGHNPNWDRVHYIYKRYLYSIYFFYKCIHK